MNAPILTYDAASGSWSLGGVPVSAGDAIRHLRGARTQATAAADWAVSRRTVELWEARRGPGPGAVLQLARREQIAIR